MTQARVQYRLSEDETLQVEFASDATHPDALDEVATRAQRLFAQVLADLFGVTRIAGEREQQP